MGERHMPSVPVGSPTKAERGIEIGIPFPRKNTMSTSSVADTQGTRSVEFWSRSPSKTALRLDPHERGRIMESVVVSKTVSICERPLDEPAELDIFDRYTEYQEPGLTRSKKYKGLVYLLASTAPRTSSPEEVEGFIHRENPGDLMYPPVDRDRRNEGVLPKPVSSPLHPESPATAEN